MKYRMHSALWLSALILRISRLTAFVQKLSSPYPIRGLVLSATVAGLTCLFIYGEKPVPAGAAHRFAARIAGIAVEPSVRKKQLGLSVEINGHLDTGAVTATGRLLDETGKEERQFTAEATSVA